MRALLAERDDDICGRTNQNAAVGGLRIEKRDRATDRNVREARNLFQFWRPAAAPEPVLGGDPELPRGERKTRQDHELHEVAARDVEILRRVDGKIAPPFRLLAERLSVRRPGN